MKKRLDTIAYFTLWYIVASWIIIFVEGIRETLPFLQFFVISLISWVLIVCGIWILWRD